MQLIHSAHGFCAHPDEYRLTNLHKLRIEWEKMCNFVIKSVNTTAVSDKKLLNLWKRTKLTTISKYYECGNMMRHSTLCHTHIPFFDGTVIS